MPWLRTVGTRWNDQLHALPHDTAEALSPMAELPFAVLYMPSVLGGSDE